MINKSSALLKIISKLKGSSTLRKRIIEGAFWSLFGQVFAKLLVVGSAILTARFLGKVAYGEFGIIRSTIEMFVIFAGFGGGLTITKYIAEHKRSNPDQLRKIVFLISLFVLITSISISALVFLFAPLISSKMMNASYLVDEIRLSSFIVFLSGMTGLQTGILVGFEKYKHYALILSIATIISSILQVTGAFLYNVLGAIIGYGIGILFLWIMNELYIKKLLNIYGIIKDKNDFLKEWKIISNFSIPAALSGFMVIPVMWICNIMLINTTNGFEEVAVFTAGNNYRNLILFIPITLTQILLPLLSDPELKYHYTKILKINLKLNIGITATISLFVIIFSQLLMKAFGNDFTSGYIVLIFLSISTIFISAGNVMGQVLASREKMWTGFFLNLIWAISLLYLTYLFIDLKLGALGLSLSYLLSYLLHTIVIFIYFYKKLGKHENSF